MNWKFPSRATGARSKASEAKPNLWVLLLIGIFPMLLLELVSLPVIETFEYAASDSMMRLRNSLDPRPLSDKLAVVGITNEDDQQLDVDLKTRQSYMELLTAMRREQAAVTAFDIFFVRQEDGDDILALNLSGEAMKTVLAYNFTGTVVNPPDGAIPDEFAPLKELAEKSVDADELQQAIHSVDDFIHQYTADAKTERQSGAAVNPVDRATRGRTALWARYLRGEMLKRWFALKDGAEAIPGSRANPFDAPDITLLSPAVMLAADRRGFANIEKGDQDVVRRVPLLYEFRGRVFPNLTFAAALAYYGVDFKDVTIHWGHTVAFKPTRNGDGDIVIPIDDRGQYRVNFREGESFLGRNPSLRAVLGRTPDDPHAGFFRDRIVLVGEVISGGLATDIEPIPLQNKFPMVGLHANTLDNILRRDFLHETGPTGRQAIAALLGVIVALLFHQLSFNHATRLTAILVMVYAIVNFWMFQSYGIIIPIVKPIIGLIAASLFFFGYVIVIKDRDRRLVRDVFMKSVSPRVAEEILKNFNDDAIWAAKREITVLFIDVRGYTTMSEQYGPEVVLDVLDQFYDTVSEAVFRHDGLVNKFMGDAVLALFGAMPEEAPDHARRAVIATAEIQKAMTLLNDQTIEPKFGLRMNTGAGVNTGEATVGLVGRRRIRIEYTALGDAVNVASRLQSLATESEIIIAESTIAHMGPTAAKEIADVGLILQQLEPVMVKGKKQAIPVYRAAPPGHRMPSTTIPKAM
ncbi:hypothetical protein BH09SUM1_BH09SUM1_03740 [soil metagenome]